jgi:hypothetical protein
VHPDIPNRLLNHRIYVDEENFERKKKHSFEENFKISSIIYLIVSKIKLRRLALLCTIAENP